MPPVKLHPPAQTRHNHTHTDPSHSRNLSLISIYSLSLRLHLQAAGMGGTDSLCHFSFWSYVGLVVVGCQFRLLPHEMEMCFHDSFMASVCRRLPECVHARSHFASISIHLVWVESLLVSAHLLSVIHSCATDIYGLCFKTLCCQNKNPLPSVYLCLLQCSPR